MVSMPVSKTVGQGSSPCRPAKHIGEYSVTGSGLDCKSSALGSAGSSPASPTNFNMRRYSWPERVNLLSKSFILYRTKIKECYYVI